MVTVEDLNRLLYAHAFTRSAGFRVLGIGDGECTLEVPYQPEHDRPGGIVSGQRYMHAADVCFWMATKSRLGMEDGSTTCAMSTAFLASAKQEAFRCRAQVLRVGARLVFGVAECYREERLLAHHTLTYSRPAIPSAARTTSS